MTPRLHQRSNMIGAPKPPRTRRVSGRGSPRQIIQPAGAEPTVAIGFEQDVVAAPCASLAMVVAENIDELAAEFWTETDFEPQLQRLIGKIMHDDHGVVPPIVTESQNRFRLDIQNVKSAEADFRRLLSHPDHPLRPVEEGVGIASLLGDVDMAERPRPVRNDRPDDLVGFREAAMALRRPLHRRARAIALGQRKIVAHADFIAISEHRRSRQRQQQAIGELEPAAVAAQHSRQSPAYAATVELHRPVRAESRKDSPALSLGEAAKIEFVMISQKVRTLPARRSRLRHLQRLNKRPRISAGQRIEQVLVHMKVEHHLKTVAFIAEIREVELWRDVRLRENYAVPFSPLQEFAKSPQHLVMFAGRDDLDAF